MSSTEPDSVEPEDGNQAITVERVDGEDRYEIRVEGRTAGYTAYRDKDGQRIFYHTEVDKAFSGRGLSTTLATRALTDTREAGRRIVPVCPFVADYLKKHGGFRDITDPVTPEALRSAPGA
ncbi:GNAT family N-acetyltransferase [Allosalinactinospora lopnorensis]|uniref:GNAT family N-acetyltransferase n=1 Tax=Allosalinactinospora lopnorensis TaxID=1352348 RepID=UPI000623EEA2|nr:GNAT family N-acetyltransferase [Allosalinactinospora lopnorensis]